MPLLGAGVPLAEVYLRTQDALTLMGLDPSSAGWS